MRPLCVIPARRGSKRLPLKNVLPLHRRPMLAYSIEAARESGLFDTVFVSTEDADIAAVAEKFGAIAHRRPADLAGDLVSATEVCLELHRSLDEQGRSYDAIVCLQPTSPLRTAEDIKGSWRRFVESGADFLVSVTPIDPHFFHWAVHQTATGWRMFFGDQYLIERPLLPPVYRPNGSIKIGRTGPLAVSRNFFGQPLEVYETPEERSVHVGDWYDLGVAEALLARRAQAQGASV